MCLPHFHPTDDPIMLKYGNKECVDCEMQSWHTWYTLQVLAYLEILAYPAPYSLQIPTVMKLQTQT